MHANFLCCLCSCSCLFIMGLFVTALLERNRNQGCKDVSQSSHSYSFTLFLFVGCVFQFKGKAQDTLWAALLKFSLSSLQTGFAYQPHRETSNFSITWSGERNWLSKTPGQCLSKHNPSAQITSTYWNIVPTINTNIYRTMDLTAILAVNLASKKKSFTGKRKEPPKHKRCVCFLQWHAECLSAEEQDAGKAAGSCRHGNRERGGGWQCVGREYFWIPRIRGIHYVPVCVINEIRAQRGGNLGMGWEDRYFKM